MSDPEALEAIWSDWLAWAQHEIEAGEFVGRVAEHLEKSGRPLITAIQYGEEPPVCLLPGGQSGEPS